jgi:glycine oxidase
MAKSYDVAIIGGGIIGCLTALRLAERGARVAVLERGETGRESSWAGAGILCPIQPWLYPDAFTHLVEASLKLYPELMHRLETQTGISPQYRRSGLLVPFFDDDVVSHREPALAWSRRFGWRVEELDARQARESEPALAGDVRGALLWPEVAQVRNPRLLRAAREAIRKLGVTVRERAEAAEIVEREGCVRGVRLINGETIAADAVLLAAGSWSAEIASRAGVRLPVAPVKGQIVLLHCKPGRVRHIIKHDRAYFVPRSDGRTLVGASMEFVGFRRGNTVGAVHALLDGVMRLTPGLADEVIERQWMGFRPGTPDGLPLLGPVRAKPGLWVATGHYRNGVALAPVTAEYISAWIMGDKPPMEMGPFLPDRPLQPSAKLGNL